MSDLKRQYRLIAIAALLVGLVATLGVLYQVLSGRRGGLLGGGGRRGPTSEMLAGMEDPATRVEYAHELGATGSEEAIAILETYARDDDPAVRVACIKALGEIGSPLGWQTPWERLFDEVPQVRAASAEAMGKIPGANRRVEGLLRASKDRVAFVREAGVRGMAGINHSNVVKRLREVVHDSAPGVRQAAAEALAGRTDPVSLRALGVLLTHESRPAVRAAAAASLLPRGAAAAEAIVAVIGGSDHRAGHNEGVALALELGGVEIIPGLLTAVGDGHSASASRGCNIADAVVAAVGKLGEAPLPVLAELARDPNQTAMTYDTLARLLAGVGDPAIPILAQRARNAGPKGTWRELWVDAIKQIDTPAAKEALSKL